MQAATRNIMNDRVAPRRRASGVTRKMTRRLRYKVGARNYLESDRTRPAFEATGWSENTYGLARRFISVSIETKETPRRPLSRAEQETETAAERLNTQIEAALAAVAVRSDDSIDELEAYADRLERAARDLAVALRELAQQHHANKDR